jgi:tetraacyldisaccharide 4'-kinase
MFIDKTLLFPYYIALKWRNYLYDSGKNKIVSYDIPVICVGNITVGGTGKTPHAEMLISLLKNNYKIALVSRGYKRKSKGYREVSVSDSYTETGDEPLQIKRKFPDITVVVDTSRKRAIDTLLALPEESRPTLIILDDAFQHRKVKPSLSIVLVDHSKPVFQDHLLPIGTLRDLPNQIYRADIVIVTKVPEYLEQDERILWREKLRLKDSQILLFSKISYEQPLAVFPSEVDNRYIYSKSAVVFSGIADDTSLKNHLMGQYKLKSVIRYSDHHDYTNSEIHHIDYISNSNATSVIITTEKDAQRLIDNPFITPNLKSKLFYIPIKSEIIPDTSDMARVIPEEMKEIGEKQLREVLEKYMHI